MKPIDSKLWYKFYECSCHTEGIMCSYEYPSDDNCEQVDIAFFDHGLVTNRKLSWTQQLRFIWKVLRTGTPYCDLVSLDKKTAKELGKDLIEWAEKKKKISETQKEKVVPSLEYSKKKKSCCDDNSTDCYGGIPGNHQCTVCFTLWS